MSDWECDCEPGKPPCDKGYNRLHRAVGQVIPLPEKFRQFIREGREAWEAAGKPPFDLAKAEESWRRHYMKTTRFNDTQESDDRSN